MISAQHSVTTDLVHHGYCFLSGSRFQLASEDSASLLQFAEAWNDLPPDAYLTEPNNYRFRRHARYRYDAIDGSITRLADGPYFQSKDTNRLFGGSGRVFAPVPQEIGANSFLNALLHFNIEHLPFAGSDWDINVHLVRIVGSQETLGEPVPEGRHRDGFAYVSMHLMRRENVVGGETEVVSENGTPIMKGVLQSPLDSLYLDDRALLHYTSPISSSTRGPAHRDMLLVSYG